MQVLAAEPVAPSRLAAKIPSDVETICLKCLEKTPARRYGTAADLAEDLRRFQSGEPIKARPISAAERLGKWIRRRPVVASLLAAVVMVTMIGGAAFAWAFNEALEARDDSSTQAKIAKEERDRAITQKGLAAAARDEALAQENIAKGARDKAQTQQNLAMAASERAQQKEAEALRQLYRAEMARYTLQIAQAKRELEAGNPARAEELLADCPLELRHIEHRFLWSLCQRRQRTLRGHVGPVLAVALSSDGQRLASISGMWNAQKQIGGSEIKIWGARTGLELLSFKGHGMAITSVALSPDGQRLATGSEDRTVKIWDAKHGKELFTLTGHSGPVKCVAFHPDGKLASAGTGSLVKIWDSVTGKELLTVNTAGRAVRSLAFSPDGKYLAAGTGKTVGEALEVWDWQASQRLHSFKTPHAVLGISFSPDGHLLAIAQGIPQGVAAVYNLPWTKIDVWDLRVPQAPFAIEGHTNFVSSVAFSPDGRYLASASWDETVKLWDLRTRLAVSTLRGHKDRVLGVAFSPDGQNLASCGKDGTIRIWDARVASDTVILREQADINSVAFGPKREQPLLAWGFRKGGAVEIWDRKGKIHWLPVGHLDEETSVAFSADGQWLATGSHDGKAKIWNAQTRQLVQSFTAVGHVLQVAFSPDGRQLAAGCGTWDGQNKVYLDGQVFLWSTQEKNEVLLLAHAGPVRSLAFSPDSKLLATADGSDGVKLWDAGSGQELKVLNVPKGAVTTSVAFSTDGQFLAAASYSIDAKSRKFSQADLKVWHVHTHQEKFTLRGHTSPISGLAFSADGKRLISATRGLLFFLPKVMGEWKAWDVQTGQELLSWVHTTGMSSVTIDPDNEWLATGCYDRMLHLWDLRSQPDTLNLKGHSDPIAHVAFSPDDRLLASAGKNGLVKVWDRARGQEMLTLRQENVTGLAFSKDGSRLSARGRDEQQTTWELKTGKEVPALPDLVFAAGPKAVSHDRRWSAQAADNVLYVIDQHVAMKERGLRVIRSATDIHWHAREAVDAELIALVERNRQFWFTAAFHLPYLVRAKPADAAGWARQGRACAEVGQWDKAAAAFSRRVKLTPENFVAWRELALTQLAAGQNDAYRQTCRRLLEHFVIRTNAALVAGLVSGGAPPDGLRQAALARMLAKQAQRQSQAIRVSLLAPGTVPDAAALLPLVTTDPVTKRLLLCRAGRYAEVEKAKLVNIFDRLSRALALHGLGRTDEAKQELDLANKVRGLAPNWPWETRLEMDLLLRELENLLQAPKR